MGTVLVQAKALLLPCARRQYGRRYAIPIINTSYQKLPFGSGDDPDKIRPGFWSRRFGFTRAKNTLILGGKKELKSSRDRNARHEPYWVGGEKSLLCDPGSELRLGGREQKGEDNKWDEKKRKVPASPVAW